MCSEASPAQQQEDRGHVVWFSNKSLSLADQHIPVGPDNVLPSSVVRDLGVFFDSELIMKSHISRITGACFYQLRQLRAVPGQLGQEVTGRLVSAFIVSRLDYCNAILAGLPAITLAPLQRVMHATARVVYDLKPYDHVTPTLKARIRFQSSTVSSSSYVCWFV